MNRPPQITAIIPAYNEAQRLPHTIQALRQIPYELTIAVVDDGSQDDTVSIAQKLADTVLVTGKNQGKGFAVNLGWQNVTGDIFLFVDADLEDSAKLLGDLIPPVLNGETDMAIAAFPPATKKGGFGLVKKFATSSIKHLTGKHFVSPLSGQRCIRKEVLERIGGFPKGWGLEVALTIDALRNGFRVQEVFIPLTHREMGRGIKGFIHRGKQLLHISKTFLIKWIRR